ncbi:hypothetical protein B0W47_00790 [Komagataeibacter nataicola]|uniref:Uncharacterized protein n=1 Tax=Komagataeibacter nataicola TaxID=265960 RepID=A0A9N7GZ10_9PROT|nr:hypothetical protein [Komagataeibacter nataicola]AQU86234.1 hypothetical protein B0W47_00790 [Komagataeibacter nataicola]PYD64926.1 hypothetical protein CDI09_16455 [Komagataeibacter nataicola]WNM08359.1 hypothetical protein RI056_16100 [Komagataeibacter nataicola]GBR26859.1 hypothetical protein AA0616_3313 [Komagataeibacter nataicola NRIC 0616]
MRHLILTAALLGTIATAQAAPSCPGDTVVWVNQDTGVYHLPGDRWYGQTRHGTYECEKQAVADGAHQSGRRGTQHPARTPRPATRHQTGRTMQDQVDDAKPSGSVENPF